MTRTIEFIVWGPPKGKPRPRLTRDGHAYTPKVGKDYEALVIESVHRDADLSRFVRWEKGVPLRVRIRAVYPIPESATKKQRALMESGELRPTKKPDCDNIEKIICDALNGFLWYDDAQVVDVRTTKKYGATPRVEVSVGEAL